VASRRPVVPAVGVDVDECVVADAPVLRPREPQRAAAPRTTSVRLPTHALGKRFRKQRIAPIARLDASESASQAKDAAHAAAVASAVDTASVAVRRKRKEPPAPSVQHAQPDAAVPPRVSAAAPAPPPPAEVEEPQPVVRRRVK
jgi:hypothetical protein